MSSRLFVYLSITTLSFSHIYGEDLPLATQSAQPSEPANAVSSKQGEPPSASKEFVLFTPPEGWLLADPSAQFPRVRMMVVGKAATSLPPSINLSTEPYSYSLKQYLKNIKNKNAAEGNEWKDLGLIKTQAGNANLSQVDSKTQWGIVRRMHIVLLKNEHIYILTAAALAEEFPQYYKTFFDSMRSLRITNDPYELILDPKEKKGLKEAANELQSKWKAALKQKKSEDPNLTDQELKEKTFFESSFQDSSWKPFKQMVEKKYKNSGADWQNLYEQKIKDELFNTKQ